MLLSQHALNARGDQHRRNVLNMLNDALAVEANPRIAQAGS